MSNADPSRDVALLADLSQRIGALGSAVVCFSGGLDSALVLAVAARTLGERALGLTTVGPALPARERADAAAFAAEIGARHRFLESNELARPGYVANGADRCFHCKSELYDLAEAVRAEEGFATVCNGTNLDDLGDHRPGLLAASAAAVRSPLVEAGLRKADVRRLAEHLGLRVWNKPASACLASRLPYGTSVTPERLSRVEQLEAALAALGFRQLRVRFHDPVARIELALDELPRALEQREPIVAAGRAAGFLHVTLDLAGYRLGSHNEALSAEQRQAALRLPVVS